MGLGRSAEGTKPDTLCWVALDLYLACFNASAIFVDTTSLLDMSSDAESILKVSCHVTNP